MTHQRLIALAAICAAIAGCASFEGQLSKKNYFAFEAGQYEFGAIPAATQPAGSPAGTQPAPVPRLGEIYLSEDKVDVHGHPRAPFFWQDPSPIYLAAPLPTLSRTAQFNGIRSPAGASLDTSVSQDFNTGKIPIGKFGDVTVQGGLSITKKIDNLTIIDLDLANWDFLSDLALEAVEADSKKMNLYFTSRAYVADMTDQISANGTASANITLITGTSSSPAIHGNFSTSYTGVGIIVALGIQKVTANDYVPNTAHVSPEVLGEIHNFFGHAATIPTAPQAITAQPSFAIGAAIQRFEDDYYKALKTQIHLVPPRTPLPRNVENIPSYSPVTNATYTATGEALTFQPPPGMTAGTMRVYARVSVLGQNAQPTLLGPFNASTISIPADANNPSSADVIFQCQTGNVFYSAECNVEVPATKDLKAGAAPKPDTSHRLITWDAVKPSELVPPPRP